MKLRVYGASKLRDYLVWHEFKEKYPDVELVSRWPFKHVDIPDSKEFAEQFWLEDEQDVTSSDVVFVLPADDLRGALVEAGMAIAAGKWVMVIGDCAAYGTWQWHPAVYHVMNLDEAVAQAKALTWRE